MAATRSPQGGIFALGTAAHAYPEFDAPEGEPTTSLVRAIASLRSRPWQMSFASRES